MVPRATAIEKPRVRFDTRVDVCSGYGTKDVRIAGVSHLESTALTIEVALRWVVAPSRWTCIDDPDLAAAAVRAGRFDHDDAHLHALTINK